MKPIIYQVLPRYWGGYSGKNVRGGSLDGNGCGRFSDIDDRSLEYFSSLHCTHLWYTGVIRHATSTDTHGCVPSHPQFVKGMAGSPYAITDYYDVNPYLADNPEERMAEFESLVERTHAHGLKVILDFVPNHVSRDNVNFGLDDDKSVHWAPENDFFYYPGERLELPAGFVPDSSFDRPFEEFPAKATGNNCFSPRPDINDWYETVKLNYCDFHTGTWDKMRDILRFWIDKGVDGFRCDMVELVPPEFFTWLIASLKKDFPELIFIAEVYKKELYRKYVCEVGFDFLYDKSGMYDILREIIVKNVKFPGGGVELWQSTRRITAAWQFLQDLQPQMLNFLENHDEQRVCCPDFAGSFPNCRAALAVSMLFNQAAFMLYSGQEVGESASYEEGYSGGDGRSSIFDWWKIESIGRLWNHIHGTGRLEDGERSALDTFRKLLALAASPVFACGNTYDLCYCNMASCGFDPDRHFAFLRYIDAGACDEMRNGGSLCVLVACNFSDSDADMELYIPTLDRTVRIAVKAFDYSTLSL